MKNISLHLEKMLFWGTLILFIFIPLYPKIPLFNVSKTFVAIRLEDLLIGVVLLLFLTYLISSGKIYDFLRNKLTLAIILFIFIGGVSLFSGVFLTKTVTLHLGVLHLLRRVEYLMLLPLVYYAISSKKQILYIIYALAAVTVIVNIYAFGQQYLSWPVISTTNSEFSKGLILYLTPGARVNSTFAGHYDLAVFLMMILVILSALAFATKNIFIWGFSIALGVSSFVVLVMTAARLSFVAAVLGIFISILLLRKKLLIILLVVVTVGAVAYPSGLRDRLLSTLTVNFQNEGDRYIANNQLQNNRSELNIPTLPTYEEATKTLEATRSGLASDIAPGEPTDSTQLGVYRSFAIRLNIEWPRAIRALVKNPLLGTGYSSLDVATDNDILRSLGEVGTLGTLAFALILFEAFKGIAKNMWTADRLYKYLSIGVVAMICGFIINGLFIDVFEASKVAILFWMILGTTLAINKIKNA